MPTAKLLRQPFALGRTPFKTFDPFLFCVHHMDQYPKGGANMGPDPSLLSSRDLGSDFSYQDGWSMYHGAEVPGFPAHPHRGFETVTVTRRGLVDHSDSLGCTARYGNGDTQWMTAGRGVQHAEMFPLLRRDGPNPMELYQIWLNLPKKDKMCQPAFSMLWDEKTPVIWIPSGEPQGKASSIRVIAGRLQDAVPPPPPPNSWAADEANDVGIWVVRLEERGASVTLPPTHATTNRTLYAIDGPGLTVGAERLERRTGAAVDPTQPLPLTATDGPVEVLVLQGRPIGEPVVQHGPMVMNTREEIFQAFQDYQRTQYGGWPFAEHDHFHGRDVGRHAVHPDGRRETPPQQ